MKKKNLQSNRIDWWWTCILNLFFFNETNNPNQLSKLIAEEFPFSFVCLDNK